MQDGAHFAFPARAWLDWISGKVEW